MVNLFLGKICLSHHFNILRLKHVSVSIRRKKRKRKLRQPRGARTRRSRRGFFSEKNAQGRDARGHDGDGGFSNIPDEEVDFVDYLALSDCVVQNRHRGTIKGGEGEKLTGISRPESRQLHTLDNPYRTRSITVPLALLSANLISSCGRELTQHPYSYKPKHPIFLFSLT